MKRGTQKHTPLYPACVNLNGRKCIVIGGGKVAQRKIQQLLTCGADVTVVSPQAQRKIAQWAERQRLKWHRKTCTPEDLTGAFMAFVATDDPQVNRHMAMLCRRRGILVNCADAPHQCDFFVPSVLRRKSLSIAVGTGGEYPLLAAEVRNVIEGTISPEYGELLDMLGKLRKRLHKTVPDTPMHKAILERVPVTDILKLLKQKKRKEAKDLLKQCISSIQD